MQSSTFVSAKLTALAVFTLSGGIVATAQSTLDRTSDVPSFKKDVPAAPAPAPDAAVPQLKPVAPMPSIVVEAARPVPTEARVIPPPPRIVRQAAGTVVVPARGSNDGEFRSSEAAVATPLQVNSAYGYRWGRKHTGIDFQASWGESVGVSLAGTVAFAGVKHGYGNVIVVDHGEGISTYYAHLSAIYVGVGQAVSASQVIGAVGSTGRSTGPHLHYEVRINGRPINPTSIISFVNGEYYVNGQPFADEPSEVAPAEPTSRLEAPAATGARPRRVVQQPGIEKHVLIYGEDSMTAY